MRVANDISLHAGSLKSRSQIAFKKIFCDVRIFSKRKLFSLVVLIVTSVGCQYLVAVCFAISSAVENSFIREPGLVKKDTLVSVDISKKTGFRRENNPDQRVLFR